MALTLSPAGWLQLLEKQLTNRWAYRMAKYDAYYEGDHRLAFATEKFREAFAGLFATIADNWCGIVVDSSAERLKVQGFRFGEAQEADADAWAIWQANGLDAESDMAHTEAIKLGEAYWLVEPPARGSSDPPRITSEHPSEMIVATAPGDRRQRLAALKRWVDEQDRYAYATLYLPDQIIKFRSQTKLPQGGMAGGQINWTRRPGDEGGPNPLRVVPVIPLRNNPSMMRGGQSDLKTAIPIQNAINKLLSDMLIGAEYQAFPQRVLLGVEVARDENGMPIKAAELQASKSRLWAISNENAKVAQFNAADLDNYVNARGHLVEHLTAQTKTPPHYVSGKMINVSGDALKAGETGLVSKVRDKQITFGEGHEETISLALVASGRRDDIPTDTETIWRDPESRSFGELVDGLVKLRTINVPDAFLWERAGFSPQEITRMKAMQLVDDVFNAPDEREPNPAEEVEEVA